MKRAMPWNSKVGLSDDDESSSDDDDDSDTNSEADDTKRPGSSGRTKKAGSKEVKAGKQKSAKVLDFEALNRHGYSGGLSVLKVPPPRVDDKDRDWSWSNGKDSDVGKETEESYEERLRTKAALVEGEKLLNVQTRKEREEQREKEWEKEREKKNASFSQKEKRKRDLGQASRGKNYVEEEKRLLRESGIYSGFDS